MWIGAIAGFGTVGTGIYVIAGFVGTWINAIAGSDVIGASSSSFTCGCLWVRLLAAADGAAGVSYSSSSSLTEFCLSVSVAATAVRSSSW